MAVLLIGGLGALGLYLTLPSNGEIIEKEAKKVSFSSQINDISTVQGLMAFPDQYFEKEHFSKDISGMPVRFLHMKNGAVYRTYDVTTPMLSYSKCACK